jgi:hypothetical protein
MMTRRAMAGVAAFAAAVSVGALGYAVVWAFDVAALAPPAPPAALAPPPPPAPRRKVLVVVAPRVPGEDVGETASPAGHTASSGATLAVAPMPATDAPSSLIAVPPPPTPATPGEDGREAASPAGHTASSGVTLAVAPMSAPDEPSSLVAVPPPPTPATPGEDGPAIAASARVSAASAAADRPMSEDAPVRSELVPQNEAKAPSIQMPAPPDPEPTGTIGPPTVFRTKPRPAPRPREDALTPPGITIIRGVPPVPGDSPSIVRPGPLIIHVPQPARR